MFKEQIASLVRYMLAGFTAWVASQLSDKGFDPDNAMAVAEAVSALVAAIILLFWSAKKNKTNAVIKQEYKGIKTGLKQEDFND